MERYNIGNQYLGDGSQGVSYDEVVAEIRGLAAVSTNPEWAAFADATFRERTGEIWASAAFTIDYDYNSHWLNDWNSDGERAHDAWVSDDGKYIHVIARYRVAVRVDTNAVIAVEVADPAQQQSADAVVAGTSRYYIRGEYIGGDWEIWENLDELEKKLTEVFPGPYDSSEVYVGSDDTVYWETSETISERDARDIREGDFGELSIRISDDDNDDDESEVTVFKTYTIGYEIDDDDDAAGVL